MKRLAEFWGVRLAASPVCEGHSAPLEFLRQQVLDRPAISLWHGPRGGGKSFVSALGAWVDSTEHDKHGTRILGGSLAQSQQIYEALKRFDEAHPEGSPLKAFTKTSAKFKTGSEVSILAASRTSVRGPHVPRLRLDEVDEIDPDIRESSLGMCMEMHGVPASVVMTSTWHRVAGPMASLIEQGKAGAFPVHTFCVFEVLERCPDERSGKHLEKCPECPLVKWCHADRDKRPDGLPKAKRSSGHYAIESLIQKAQILSPRVFGSDYLCDGPKADGVWFTQFDQQNVGEDAEYDPTLSVHVAVDSGVHTGGVFFQTREIGDLITVNVFAEHFAEGLTAEANAGLTLNVYAERCPNATRRVSTDSAGGARNPIGPSVIAEYMKAGLVGDNGLESWPKYPGCVGDGLRFLEALVRSADGRVGLVIHPRCQRTIAAFQSYTRANRAGQWQDYPEDPQHPHEEMIDSLRGGLALLYPEGRRPAPKLRRVHGSSLI